MDPALKASPSPTGPVRGRLAPAGTPILAALQARRAAHGGNAQSAAALLESAAKALQARLGVRAVTLHGSGREALRRLFAALARHSGRNEAVLPGYTCYSVAAAAVAAGLRVRLADVTPTGQLDPEALVRLPLERAAAVVACNLFGLAEPLAPLRTLANAAGATLIDDLAQAFGAEDAEGPVGGRGELGILSFGRGKPLCALAGGAIIWPSESPLCAEPVSALPRSRWIAPLRALGYSLALHPVMFRLLCSIPALEIGVTRFDPEFVQADIDTATLELLLTALECSEAQLRERTERAERLASQIRETSSGLPLVAPGKTRGAYPRLAILAPTAEQRDAALARLTDIGAGASGLYPAALCDVLALKPHRAGDEQTPTARQLAARILTLPTHKGLRGTRLEQTLACLASVWPK